ncbi:LPD38 domain-containing protein, partial [Desulfobacter sp.]|uniref:LPD38 domain-containing protein n=1 Tax=Desulfobacter sp. TaxID=2294 RepID=UPI003D0B7861
MPYLTKEEIDSGVLKRFEQFDPEEVETHHKLAWDNAPGYRELFDEPEKFEPGMSTTATQERGFFGDVASNLARGASDLTRLGGYALKTLDPDGGIDMLEKAGQGLVDASDYAEQNWDIMKQDQSEREGEGYIKSGVMSGIRSSVPSLAPTLAGASVGAAFGGPVGGLVGALIGNLGLFGLGTYGEKKQEYLNNGLPEDMAHSAALKQGLIEGGIEGAASFIGAKIFGMDRLIAQPLKQTVKELLHTPVSTFAKNLAKDTFLNEIPTEMLQSYLGAKVDIGVGMANEGDQWQAAVDSIIPSMTMSLLFGMGAGGFSYVQKRRLVRDLNNLENPDAREKAAELIEKGILQGGSKEEPGKENELAEAWSKMVMGKIDAGEAIDINEDFVKYASLDENSRQELQRGTELQQYHDHIAGLEKRISNLQKFKKPTDRQRQLMADYQANLESVKKGLADRMQAIQAEADAQDAQIGEFEQNLQQAKADIKEYPGRPPIQPDVEGLRREYENEQLKSGLKSKDEETGTDAEGIPIDQNMLDEKQPQDQKFGKTESVEVPERDLLDSDQQLQPGISPVPPPAAPGTSPGTADDVLTSGLKNKEQQAFIDQRIKKLGSIEAVDKAYDLDDQVSQYARAKAREVFGQDAPAEVAEPVEETQVNPEITEPVESKIIQSKEHIGFFTRPGTKEQVEVYKDANGEVYTAPVSNVIDVDTGYRIGRFEAPAHLADQAVKNLLNNTPNTSDSSAPMGGIPPTVKENLTVAPTQIETGQKKIPGQAEAAEDMPSAFEHEVNPDKIETNPTEPQKEAGNYRKDHIRIDGHQITIENPDGSTRSGTDKSGRKWESKIHGHYGYFKRTMGKDGDQVDVFIKPGTKTSSKVFIVDQIDPGTGEFDEHKVVMGAESADEAKSLYMSNYEEGWKGFGGITEMNQDEFKVWVKDGTRTTKPVGIISKTSKTVKKNLTVAPGRAVTWQDKKGNTLSGKLIRPQKEGGKLWMIKKAGGKNTFVHEKNFKLNDSESTVISGSQTPKNASTLDEIEVNPVEKITGEKAAQDGTQYSTSVDFTDSTSRNTDTPAFRKWFGNSKVVDENGDPVVVYHGTNVNFNAFKPSEKTGTHGETDQIEGIYFTDNKDGANWYALVEDDDRFLKRAYVSIKNPYHATDIKSLKNGLGVETLGDVADKVKSLGHDGLIIEKGFYSNGGPHRKIIAFDPTQIKSIYNAGTWDGSNPDIRYSISSINPWPENFPNVVVHTAANKVAPNQKGQGGHPDHKAAKAGDVDAANRLVFDLVKPEKVLELKKQFPDAMVVPVHAEEEAGKNKIPRALARAYGEIAGFKVDLGIVQTNKSGHTKKDAAERIISRAEFDGDVNPGQEYIILDDIITTGETLSELRHYIENNGGKVVAASTLGYSKYSTVLAVKQDSLKKIQDKFNVKELEDVLKEFNIAGNIQALTNSEAKYILSFRAVDAFRNRILEAGRNRSGQSKFSVFQGEVRRFQEETWDSSSQRINTLPGQGLTTQDIQKHFKGQKAFLSPDGKVSIKFKNGHGCTVETVKKISDKDYEFAMRTGRMGKDGIILGKYSNQTIQLSRDYASDFTLDHEIEHLLEDLGIITPAEIMALNGKARQANRSGQWEAWGLKWSDNMAENRANFLAQALTDRGQHRNTWLDRVIQKIVDFLDGLLYVASEGVRVRKLARDVESGKVFGRQSDKAGDSIPIINLDKDLSKGVVKSGTQNGTPVPRFAKIGLRETGELRVPRRTVRNVSDAAQMLSGLSDAAQEEVYLITADRTGRVLEVHKFSKGTSGKSDAHINQMAGHLLKNEEAHTTYLIHNHISGDLTPSNEDLQIMRDLRLGLRLAGIKVSGLIISDGHYAQFDEFNVGGSQKIKQLPAKSTLPVSERRVISRELQNPLSIKDVNAAMERFEGEQDGILLMDEGRREVAFIPFKKGVSIREAARDILAQASDVNAVQAVINMQTFTGTNRGKLYQHLAEGLATQNIDINDIITKNPFGRLTSMLETNQLPAPDVNGMRALDSDEVLYQTSDDIVDELFHSRGNFFDRMKDSIEEGKTEFTDRTIAKTVDSLHFVKKRLGDEAYKLHRVLTGIKSASFSMFLEHGKMSWDGNALTVTDRKNGFLPFLRSIGDDWQNLFYWIAAKRSEELEAEGRENWITPEKRARLLERTGEFSEKGESWASLNDKFQEFNQNILDVMEASGLIDPEARKIWESNMYIPFYRVLENEISRQEFLSGPRKSGKHISAQIKQLKGGQAKIGDPLENILMNWMYGLDAAARNKARAKAFEVGKNLDIIDEVAKKDLAKVLGAQTVNRFAIIKAGNTRARSIFDSRVEAEAEVENLKKDGKGPHRIEPRKETKIVFGSMKDYGILSFQKEGNPVYFKTDDPDLYQALAEIDTAAFNNLFMKMMGGAKRYLSYGATFGPAFRLRNFIRDAIHTPVVSKEFRPFVDSAIGLIGAMQEDKDYIELMSSGWGFGSSYVNSDDPQTGARFIKKIIKAEGKSAIGRILNTPLKVIKLWEKIGEASENAARLGLYKRLKNKGYSKLDAGFEARDLMDFSMHGSSQSVQTLIRIVPFLNARVQGLYKLGRASKENPKAFLLKASILTGASLLLWSLYKDDDRYKKLEDWDKWTYYHFWLENDHYRIPKPFEIGALFSSLPESVANVMNDTEDGQFVWGWFKHTAYNVFNIDMPQLFKPVVEDQFNIDTFQGRPIVPDSLAKLKPSEQYTPRTSDTMRALGHALNISPIRLEHLINGYFSTMGMMVLFGTDAITRHAMGYPSRMEGSRNPFMLHIIDSNVPWSTKHVTRFYDLYAEIDSANRTLNNYLRSGQKEEAKAFFLENKDLIQFGQKNKKLISKMRASLTEINRRQKQIMMNKSLSPKEKRQRIYTLNTAKSNITQALFRKISTASQA